MPYSYGRQLGIFYMYYHIYMITHGRPLLNQSSALVGTSKQHLIEFHLSETSRLSRAQTWTAGLTDRDANHCVTTVFLTIPVPSFFLPSSPTLLFVFLFFILNNFFIFLSKLYSFPKFWFHSHSLLFLFPLWSSNLFILHTSIPLIFHAFLLASKVMPCFIISIW